jgi:hypothetical protein
MVRRGTFHRAVLTLCCATIAATASAQGLGEVAKKTEEQQKTSPGTAIVVRNLPPSPNDSGPMRLTEEVLSRYLEGRLALADLRRADKPLERRLHTGKRQAKHYDELGPVYGREQAIVDLLSTYGLTTSEFLYIESTMMRGQDYARYPQLSMDRLSPRDRENVQFVKSNLSLVDSVLQRCRNAERGLTFLSVIPAVH